MAALAETYVGHNRLPRKNVLTPVFERLAGADAGLTQECHAQADRLGARLGANQGRLSSAIAKDILGTQNRLFLEKLSIAQDGALQNVQRKVRASEDASFGERLKKGLISTGARMTAVFSAASVIPGGGRFFAAGAAIVSGLLDNSKIAFTSRIALDRYITKGKDVREHLEARFTDKKTRYSEFEQWRNKHFDGEADWQKASNDDEMRKHYLTASELIGYYGTVLLFDRKETKVKKAGVKNRLEEVAQLVQLQEALLAHLIDGRVSTDADMKDLLARGLRINKFKESFVLDRVRNTVRWLNTKRVEEIAIALSLSAAVPLALGGLGAWVLNHFVPDATLEDIKEIQKSTYEKLKSAGKLRVADYFTYKDVNLEDLPIQAMPTFRQMLAQEIAPKVDEMIQTGNTDGFISTNNITAGHQLMDFFDTNIAGKVSNDQFATFIESVSDKNLTDNADVNKILTAMPHMDSMRDQIIPMLKIDTDLSLLMNSDVWFSLSEDEKQEVLEFIRQKGADLQRAEVKAFIQSIVDTKQPEIEFSSYTLARGDTAYRKMGEWGISLTDRASIAFFKDNIDVFRKGAFALKDANAIRGIDELERLIDDGQIDSISQANAKYQNVASKAMHWWLAGDEVKLRDSYDNILEVPKASLPQTDVVVQAEHIALAHEQMLNAREQVDIKSFYPARIQIIDPETGRLIFDQPIVHLPNLPVTLGETPTFRDGRLQDVVMWSKDVGIPGIPDRDDNTILSLHRTRQDYDAFGVKRRFPALGKILENDVKVGHWVDIHDVSGRMNRYIIDEKASWVHVNNESYVKPTYPFGEVITLVTCQGNPNDELFEDYRVYLRALPIKNLQASRDLFQQASDVVANRWEELEQGEIRNRVRVV